MKACVRTTVAIILTATASLWAAAAPDDDVESRPADDPRSPAAVRARKAYEAEVADAQAEFARALKQLNAAYAARVRQVKTVFAEDVEVAVKGAMKAGDLDEANRLTALKQRVREDPLTPAGGGGDSGPSFAIADEGDTVFLSDLEHFDVQTADHWFGKKGVARAELKVVVGGKYSPNGICLHPPSSGRATVKFRIGGRFQRFKSHVAINDTAVENPHSPVTFLLFGDGKELWRSKPLRQMRAVQFCDVPVKGVKEVELRAEVPGSYLSAHAVWLEPRLLKARR